MIVFAGLANDGSQNDLYELNLESFDDENKDAESEHLFSPLIVCCQHLLGLVSLTASIFSCRAHWVAPHLRSTTYIA
jgi:hypothetical protein